MKFKKETISGLGHTRYWLACSKEEIELLEGLVHNCLINFPKTFELTTTRNRLRTIHRELKKIKD